METAHGFNHRSPLLENDAASNEQRQLFRICPTFKEPTPLEKNDPILNDRTPRDGYDVTSNGEAPLGRSGVTSNGETLLEGSDVTSNGEKPMDGSDVTSNRETPLNVSPAKDSDSNPLIIPMSRNSEQEMDEVSLEEVVQAMFSVWRKTKTDKEIGPFYFTAKDLCAMHLAWKNVNKEKHCASEPHIIAEALALAMALELNPVPPHPSGEEYRSQNYHRFFQTHKSLLAANLLDEWDLIIDGDYPDRYTATICVDSGDESAPAASEFWRKQVELYDKARDFVHNKILQVILHSLLVFWPISLLIVGSKYMECPISHQLSYLLIILGCIGCLAFLVRLAIIAFTREYQHPNHWFWEKIGLKLIEFAFLVVFIVQAFHFFDTDPTTEADLHHCVEKFYTAALGINYLSIVLVSVYVFVYIIKLCAFRFDFWIWFIRHF